MKGKIDKYGSFLLERAGGLKEILCPRGLNNCGDWCSKRGFLIEIYNRFICKDWTLDKNKLNDSIKQFLTLGEKQRIV